MRRAKVDKFFSTRNCVFRQRKNFTSEEKLFRFQYCHFAFLAVKQQREALAVVDKI